MKTKEIPSAHWQEFCEQFSENNSGSMVDIDFIDLEGRHRPIGRDLPLLSFESNNSNPCNYEIHVSMGRPGMRAVTHEVIEPIHFCVKQSDDGKKFLQIEAENGVTLVTFHSGRFPVFADAKRSAPEESHEKLTGKEY
jgi:hypothetical protein